MLLFSNHTNLEMRYSLEACRTNALMEEFRKANAALTDKFEQLSLDLT